MGLYHKPVFLTISKLKFWGTLSGCFFYFFSLIQAIKWQTRDGNRLSYEVHRLDVKLEILRQLERRLWQYLYETGLKLWIAGLEYDVETVVKHRAEQNARKRVKK
jgi:hypothetical protein